MKYFPVLLGSLALLGAGCWSRPVPVAVNPPAVPAPISAEPTPEAPVVILPVEATSTAPVPSSVIVSEPPTNVPSPSVPKAPEQVYITVEMSQDGFKPAQIAIKKDTIVRFKNVGGSDVWPASDPHPVHTTYQDFDARRMVKSGETYEFKFKNVGTWGCHDHLSPGLTCRIVVGE